MSDNLRKRDWLEAEELESGGPGLPRADLNPLTNTLLGENMGRWAQVYFTNPPQQREHAVEKLLEELKAESGRKRPPGNEKRGTPEVAQVPEIRGTKTENKLVEVPISSHSAEELNHKFARDLVVCSACQHKNAAEQRFCGICGATLNGDLPAAEIASKPQQVNRREESPESDWAWLRQRSLSTYEVQKETRSYSRALWLLLALLVIAVGGYFVVQTRHRLAQQAATAADAAPERSSAAPLSVPIPATPATAPPAPDVNTATKVDSARGPALPTVDKKSNTTTNPAPALPSDAGRNELDRARQYLDGKGVPRNSWMASQFLWKAVAKQNSEAVLLLSDLYARGDGVPRSCEQARILLVSAAKKGSSPAAEKLRSIESSCR